MSDWKTYTQLWDHGTLTDPAFSVRDKSRQKAPANIEFRTSTAFFQALMLVPYLTKECVKYRRRNRKRKLRTSH